jgi:predicted membrane chloride channel (bestrophin family)
VGGAYTLAERRAVGAYVTANPPNVTVTVAWMSCFAVGVITYSAAVTRATVGEAVVRAYVAPVDATE